MTGRKNLLAGAGAGAFAALLGAGASAYAQEISDEIVVTAQKRSERLQDVPLSITALSAENIEQAGITEFRDYAVRIPNLAFSYSNSVGAQSQAIAIRGVFGANTTGVYLDEVPLPSSVDPRVADIERIEVLRGPQGTLYGARSMGGTVRLITSQPDLDEFSGHARAVGSHTDEGSWNGSSDMGLNIPVVEGVFALRGNIFYDYEDGVFDRVASADAPIDFGVNENVDGSRRVGGQLAGRLSLLNGRLTVTPRFAFENADTFGRAYADIAPGNFTHSRMFNEDEKGWNDWRLYSVSAQYDVSYGTFVSSTSHFTRDFGDSEDFAEFTSFAFGLPPSRSVIRANGEYEATAQELRFVSDFSGPLQLTAGVFYQSTDNAFTFPPTPVGDVFSNIFSQRLQTEVEEQAVFGEARYSLTDRLHVTIGARWFDNSVDFNGFQTGDWVSTDTFAGSQAEQDINPRYRVEYDVTDDVLVYANAAKGFRIGGVNSFSNLLCAPDLAALGISAADALSFDSDTLWSYELGAKTSWAQNRFTANGAIYSIEWDGLQQLVPLTSCGFFLTLNAGTAESVGFELEFTARLTDDLTLTAGVGHADTEITSAGAYGASIPVGAPVQQVPEWTYSAALDYRFDLMNLPAYAHLDYSFVGESYSGNNDSLNRRVRPSYEIVNLRSGIELGSWQLAAFAYNLFNEHANLSDVPPLAIESPGRPRIATNRPRTIGLEARVNF